MNATTSGMRSRTQGLSGHEAGLYDEALVAGTGLALGHPIRPEQRIVLYNLLPVGIGVSS